jgi:hypothetical protein
MIDHLITFESAAAAATALQPFGLASFDENEQPTFAAPVILNIGGANDQSIRIILSEAVGDRSDPDPQNWTITTPEVLASGWHCIVVRPALDEALRDLPGNACRLIADRDAAIAGNPAFIVYTAPDLDQGLLNTARVEPTPSGARYPFGVA